LHSYTYHTLYVSYAHDLSHSQTRWNADSDAFHTLTSVNTSLSIRQSMAYTSPDHTD
jgi:hypothetical protein